MPKHAIGTTIFNEMPDQSNVTCIDGAMRADVVFSTSSSGCPVVTISDACAGLGCAVADLSCAFVGSYFGMMAPTGSACGALGACTVICVSSSVVVSYFFMIGTTVSSL